MKIFYVSHNGRKAGIWLCGAALLVTGCQSGGSSVEQGITLTVRAQLTPTADGSGGLQPQPAGSKTFENSEGVTVRVNEGYLVLWSISIESQCNEPDFTASVPWWSVFISSAYAHTESTPWLLGEPTVIPLTTEDLQPIELGTLTPPPGSYCGAVTQLINADADANGLPATVNMIGRSLYLDAAYSTDGGQTWNPFIIDTGMSLLPAKRIFPLPMSLSDNQRSGVLDLSLAYQRWFDGVDMANMADTNQLNQLLFNITNSIHAAAQQP